MSMDYKSALNVLEAAKGESHQPYYQCPLIAPDEMNAIRHALQIAEKLELLLITADGWEDGETFYKDTVMKIREMMKEIDNG